MHSFDNYPLAGNVLGLIPGTPSGYLPVDPRHERWLLSKALATPSAVAGHGDATHVLGGVVIVRPRVCLAPGAAAHRGRALAQDTTARRHSKAPSRPGERGRVFHLAGTAPRSVASSSLRDEEIPSGGVTGSRKPRSSQTFPTLVGARLYIPAPGSSEALRQVRGRRPLFHLAGRPGPRCSTSTADG